MKILSAKGNRGRTLRRTTARLLVAVSALSLLAVVHAGSASADEGIVCTKAASGGGVSKAQLCIRKSGSTIAVDTHFYGKTSACVVQQVLWKKASSGSTPLVTGGVHACVLTADGTTGPRYTTTTAIPYYATARVYPQGTAHHETSFLLTTDVNAIPMPPDYPARCNQWLNYGQWLYFYACSPNQGRTVELLTFDGDWHAVCVRDQYIARWDRGGYAGYRLGSPELCSWENSNPTTRQPGH